MFEVRYHDRVVSEDLPSLPSAMRSRVRAAIEQRLVVDPISYGKPLRYALRGQGFVSAIGVSSIEWT